MMLPLWVRNILGKPHQVFTNYFFDPWTMVKKWLGLYFFAVNAYKYRSQNDDIFLYNVSAQSGQKLRLTWNDLCYRSYDRFDTAGDVQAHYFLQDTWAARYIYENNIKSVIDVGSRLDGYVTHLLPFCTVTFLDIRKINVPVTNLHLICGSITQLPFSDNSVNTLSTLHVFEHIGLGRYGDPVDPDGHRKAARELQRVLAPGGVLIFSTVVGKERLCFDAHRIFNPYTILSLFPGLSLVEFRLIDDIGKQVREDATLDEAANCHYGCGIFVFTK